jgi:hypothetical protein
MKLERVKAEMLYKVEIPRVESGQAVLSAADVKEPQ